MNITYSEQMINALNRCIAATLMAEDDERASKEALEFVLELIDDVRFKRSVVNHRTGSQLFQHWVDREYPKSTTADIAAVLTERVDLRISRQQVKNWMTDPTKKTSQRPRGDVMRVILIDLLRDRGF